ncbi:MAG: DUF2267 domain-containing protein [Alphaproteobacteria bacterium]|nr:DUF2267 domain-containing protein [Alphaproteobacteria bacterium]
MPPDKTPIEFTMEAPSGYVIMEPIRRRLGELALLGKFGRGLGTRHKRPQDREEARMSYPHNVQGALNTFQEWIVELTEMDGIRSPEEAYSALRAVLQTLRDRMPVEELAQFSAQLPMIARGIMFEGWDPTGKPEKFDMQEFVDAVRRKLAGKCGDIDPLSLVQNVFSTLDVHVSKGEMDDVRGVMPRDLKAMWSQRQNS